MKFKVLQKSYLFGEMIEEGEVYDFPEDKLPRDSKGKIRFDKMSRLECLEAPEADESDEGLLTQDQADEAILAALGKLDKAVDAHWTKGGLPDVKAVIEIAGFEVKRADIERVAPSLVRPAE